MAAATHVGSDRPTLAFDATGERLACATSAEQVGVWRFRGGLVQENSTWLNEPRIARLRFGPGANLLAGATTEGQIVVLAIGTGAHWQSEPVHKGTILDLAFTGPTGLRSVDSEGSVIDWALGEEGIRLRRPRSALGSQARRRGLPCQQCPADLGRSGRSPELGLPGARVPKHPGSQRSRIRSGLGSQPGRAFGLCGVRPGAHGGRLGGVDGGKANR